MKTIDRMTTHETKIAIKGGFFNTFAISTDFGVVDISRKEALRMVETCEMDEVIFTVDGRRLILEYPE